MEKECKFAENAVHSYPKVRGDDPCASQTDAGTGRSSIEQ